VVALQYLPGVECYQFGTGNFVSDRELEPEDQRECMMGWEMSKRALASGEYDLVILDELLYALAYRLLDWNEFLQVMETRSEKTEVVLTGRKVCSQLVDYADLVSEVVMVKHPYQLGISARKGIEY